MEIRSEQMVDEPNIFLCNLHAFRWDQALSFARWLLKDEYLKEIIVT